MRIIKATLLAAVLAVVSLAGVPPNETFAAVPTAASIAPAAAASAQGSPTEQVRMRRGDGRGMRRDGRGMGRRGWGRGRRGWCFYHPNAGRCRRR